MNFFRGLFIALILWVGIAGIASADDYIETGDLSQVAVSKVLDFDNMTILVQTNTVEIRTIEKQLDADGVVVSQKAGRNFIYVNIADNPETEDIDETNLAYNIFMQKLGLTKAKVKQAIREMELGQ